MVSPEECAEWLWTGVRRQRNHGARCVSAEGP